MEEYQKALPEVIRRPQSKTQNKNNQSDASQKFSRSVQRLPPIKRRRMRKSQQQYQQNHPPERPRVPVTPSQKHQSPRRNQRKPLMSLRRQTIEDVPAVQLPHRQQIQSRRQQPNPRSQRHWVKQQRFRLSPRMEHHHKNLHQPGKSINQSTVGLHARNHLRRCNSGRG